MSKLYLVPTPIGNLEDITFRAIRILKECDLILAEDTRTTGKLLKHYGIETRMQSYHIFNEHKTAESLAAGISNGRITALVTDAGTPGISDPGFLLVRECLAQHVEVECLPGAVSFIPALVASGLPCERFCFEGFLPHKKGREKRMNALTGEDRTMVFLESPHRVLKTLTRFAEIFGNDRKACAAREITKIHEEFIRGTLDELTSHFNLHAPKGEFVLVVEGCSKRKGLSTEDEDTEL
jgi:16S rRNA (cytidine1402-2'-O)-methyltransferase